MNLQLNVRNVRQWMESEVAAENLPSWGPEKMPPQKNRSILSINTWAGRSYQPFRWGTKIFQRLWRQPISPYWLVLWSGSFKHFGPLEGGGVQGLHPGAPRGTTSNTSTSCLSFVMDCFGSFWGGGGMEEPELHLLEVLEVLCALFGIVSLQLVPHCWKPLNKP